MINSKDEKLIKKCIDDFLNNNQYVDSVDLKLKIWELAKVLSSTGEITKELINNILDDLTHLDEKISSEYEWKLKDEIVDTDLCAKCGTCNIVCPNNLVKFKEKPFINDECLRKGHGMCAEVCPRQYTGTYDVRNRLDNLEEYYYAKSNIEGQSGGVVTKFLQNLLDDGEIDGAVVIGANHWKPVSVIVTSSDGLFNLKNNTDTSKSKYAISSLQAIREAGEMGLEKIAVVGLPCQVAGLRNIQYHPFMSKHGAERGKNGKPVKLPKIEYILGLFCTEKFEYSELINKVHNLNIPIDDVVKCDVKGKNFIVSTEEEDYPISLNEINASPGCLMCRDFDSELADISFGDKGSPDGYSTIIIRSQKGRIIEKYFDLNQEVKIDEIEFMRNFKIKRFEKEVERRKNEGEKNSYYYIWRHAGLGAASNNQAYLRFRTTIGGYYDPEILRQVIEIAEKYNAKIKLTSREEVEIQEIDYEDVEDIISEFKDSNVLINGTEGPLFRSIMACPGLSHCNLGLIDTNELAADIEESYAEKPANYKFKMGITGCPNRCLAVTTTDFGINGIKTPETNENCNGCGRCSDVCKVDAIDIRGETSITNYGICVSCGKCIKACPNKGKNIKYEGYSLFIGGKGGRETIIGHEIRVKTKDEIYKTFDAVFETYNDLSIKPQKERLAHTIKRVGELDFFNKVEELKKSKSKN